MLRTLVITDYCGGGSIEAYAASQKSNSVKIRTALDVYQQMAKIPVPLRGNVLNNIDPKYKVEIDKIKKIIHQNMSLGADNTSTVYKNYKDRFKQIVPDKENQDLDTNQFNQSIQ